MALSIARNKVRITALSYHGFTRLVHSITSDYEGRAEFTVVDELFEEAVAIARRLVAENKVDVFLSAGANSAYLKDTIGVPVVRVPVTGVDLMRAMLKARQTSDHIAVVTYGERNSELDEIQDLINIDIAQRSYRTADEAKAAFRELAHQGFRVIIGSSLIVELAEREGLIGILVYSRNSVRQTIENAIEIARIRSVEEQRAEQIDTILRHLNEGVLAVDAEQRILSINPAMGVLTGLSEDSVSGQYLDQLLPQLSLRETLKRDQEVLGRVEKINRKTVVTNRIPIRINGEVRGAVLTVQDAKVISQVDRSIRARNRRLRFSAKYDFSKITGQSLVIKDALSLCATYAATDGTVLITGETGTGKELFAQSIHNASKRHNAPFVAVNCAAIPDTLLESELFGYEEGAFTGSRKGGQTGLFELAHTGTIFLDEIAEIPVSLQTRLLRVLQENLVSPLGGDPVPIDVRVIAATNRDLKDAIANGHLREDLYYRLNILRVRLPALRERGEDIPTLARQLLKKNLAVLSSSRDVEPLMKLLNPYLRKYPWPGNVRELENVVERLAVLYAASEFDIKNAAQRLSEIVPEFFTLTGNQDDAADKAAGTLKSFVQNAEHSYIQDVLKECHGNVTKAAHRLGVSRTTLWRKLQDYSPYGGSKEV